MEQYLILTSACFIGNKTKRDLSSIKRGSGNSVPSSSLVLNSEGIALLSPSSINGSPTAKPTSGKESMELIEPWRGLGTELGCLLNMFICTKCYYPLKAYTQQLFPMIWQFSFATPINNEVITKFLLYYLNFEFPRSLLGNLNLKLETWNLKTLQ